MKTLLLLLGALTMSPMPACESRDSKAQGIRPHARGHLVAATHTGKSAPTQAPALSAVPATPTPKPAEKERTRRPARPEYLFL